MWYYICITKVLYEEKDWKVKEYQDQDIEYVREKWWLYVVDPMGDVNTKKLTDINDKWLNRYGYEEISENYYRVPPNLRHKEGIAFVPLRPSTPKEKIVTKPTPAKVNSEQMIRLFPTGRSDIGDGVAGGDDDWMDDRPTMSTPGITEQQLTNGHFMSCMCDSCKGWRSLRKNDDHDADHDTDVCKCDYTKIPSYEDKIKALQKDDKRTPHFKKCQCDLHRMGLAVAMS